MATWNTIFANSPGASDDASQGDDRIRELKAAIYERLVKELVMDTSSGLVAEDGWLRAGAAKIYYGASAPTTRPDGVTALTAADYGRLWYNTSTLKLLVYTASGWINPEVAEADHADSASSVDTVAPHSIVRLTSGSGNWTVPANVTRIKVTCVGGGGGGGGGGDNTVGGDGGSGTNSTFAGATTGVGASGGAGANPSYSNAKGGIGAPGGAGSAGGVGGSPKRGPGGQGGGAGAGSTVGIGGVGLTGNFGGGGSGGTGSYTGSLGQGGGGGGGTNISAVIGDILSVTPGSTIAYSVGGGGSGGIAGSGGYAGGAGGSGIIIIEY